MENVKQIVMFIKLCIICKLLFINRETDCVDRNWLYSRDSFKYDYIVLVTLNKKFLIVVEHIINASKSEFNIIM